MSAEEEAALEKLIAKEPGNISALIRKADLRLAAGDDKLANAFYLHAINAASRTQLTSDLLREVRRAQSAAQGLALKFQAHLEDTVTKAGFAPGHRPARFQEALDILLGRKQHSLTLQKPRTLFYPGLPERRYYEAHEFPWAKALQRKTGKIRKELRALLEGEQGFEPYLYSDPSRPPKHGLVDNLNWSSFNLWDGGTPIEENIAKCPLTAKAVQETDLLRLPKRAPQVMFSKLAGGAHIEPHVGLLNCRLVCHLPIIVPDGCMFRVGGEDRTWHEGKLLVFDDSIVHEAINRSQTDRVVLIFEIWHPELTEDERLALTALFDAVDNY